jgi:DNA/RNA-binding domain of Phe-tRNA-synthetase-like protein
VSEELADGAIAPELRAEFPKLRLVSAAVEASDGRSSRDARRRLGMLSARFRGAQAVVLRQSPVPQAYRVFFRHIGLDPDVDRPPAEAAAVARLVAGEFRATGRVGDALTIPLVETGVPLWALDADLVTGGLVLRPAGRDETLGGGEEPPPVPEDRLVIADDRGPVAILFGDLADDRTVSKATERVLVFSVAVPGVPDIHVDEAMATCLDLLTEH